METDLAGLGDGSNHAWAAYDPTTNMFPLSPTPRSWLPIGFEFGIESSPTPIPADRDALVLSFDVYNDLPLRGWMFYTWWVGAEVDGCMQYRNHGYIYYDPSGRGGWQRGHFEIQGGVPPEATEVTVRLVALDWSFFLGAYPTEHTAAPFFDNVEISTVP